MAKKGYCRICEFWNKYPYKISDQEFFEAKCRQGISLRKLELLLESYGLKAKKDLINKHIHECLGIAREREIEKEVKRKTIGRKLRNFFVKPEPSLPKGCEHRRTKYSFEHNYSTKTSDGLVHVICLDCGAVVSKFDPELQERSMRRDPRNLVIYESLRRKRP